MITKPKFKDSFHVEVIDGQNVCLLTENTYWILNGQVYAHLAPDVKMDAVSRLVE